MNKEYFLIIFSLILPLILISSISAAITIVSPASYTNWSGRTLVVFNVSYANGTDYNDALNATFYYNLSGVWTYIGFTTDCNNGATFASCNKSINISTLTQGRYSINATIGNDTTKGASIITTNVVFDWTPPDITIIFPANNTNTSNAQLNINYTYSDIYGITNCWYSNNSGKNNNTLAGCGNITGRTWLNGTNNITIWVNDSAGNINSTGVTFILDSIKPNVTFITPVNNGNYSGTTILNVSVSDALLEVKSVYFNITNSSGTQVNFAKASALGDYYNASIDSTLLSDGKYNITAYANDTANNLNNTEKVQITIDNTAPTGSFSCSPSSVSIGEVVTCSCSPTDALSGIDASITSYTLNPPTTTVGIINAVCLFYDLAGNLGSASTSYTVNSISGGGVITPKTTIEKINSWTKITPGAVAIMKDFKKDFGIKQIQIEVNNEAQNVKITVTKYESKPAEISAENLGKVDKYLQIKEQNLKEKLKGATLTIQVEKSWISNNSLDKDNIALFKFDETSKQWTELPTTFKEEDSTYYYYDVELNSFSYFAIAEKGIPEKEKIVEVITKNYLWIWIIIAVIILAIVFFLLKVKKKKKK